jgi:UDP-GlcNAc:undecaprenyl-phosphate/decaprenyl-phosphate GlcNAc-1-phosphate transferase
MGDLRVAALAFAVTLAASPVVLRLLRRIGLVDIPTSRSSHQSVTPRGGGVAPALACVLAVAGSTQVVGSDRAAVLVVAVGLGLIGLADDLQPRPAVSRLTGQLVVALVALIWLVPGIGGGGLLLAAAGAGIVVGIIGYTNAFNFMDGINGLAVAQVVVAGVAWWLIGWHDRAPALAAAGAIAAAAAAGFAPFNAPRAKMFLGDVGSYFLGGWLAAAAIIGLRSGIAPEAVLAPLSLFLADAGVTLARRVRRHEPWSEPHRDHAYQRLVAGGWSHGHTTLVVGLVMVTTSALGALSLTATPALRAAGDLGELVVLAAYLRLPSLLTAEHDVR